MSENVPGYGVQQIDKDIFEMHNNLRKNPKMLVPDLEAMLEQFDGMLLKRPGKVTLRTKEGKEAVQEAIKFLNEASTIQPLRWSNEVGFAARDHGDDIGPKGLIQHDSSDGRTGVKERMRKYGNIVSCYGENLSFHCEDAKEVMI